MRRKRNLSLEGLEQETENLLPVAKQSRLEDFFPPLVKLTTPACNKSCDKSCDEPPGDNGRPAAVIHFTTSTVEEAQANTPRNASEPLQGSNVTDLLMEQTLLIAETVKQIFHQLELISSSLRGLHSAPDNIIQANNISPFKNTRTPQVDPFKSSSEVKQPPKDTLKTAITTNLRYNSKSIGIRVLPFKGKEMDWSSREKASKHLAILLRKNLADINLYKAERLPGRRRQACFLLHFESNRIPRELLARSNELYNVGISLQRHFKDTTIRRLIQVEHWKKVKPQRESIDISKTKVEKDLSTPLIILDQPVSNNLHPPPMMGEVGPPVILPSMRQSLQSSQAFPLPFLAGIPLESTIKKIPLKAKAGDSSTARDAHSSPPSANIQSGTDTNSAVGGKESDLNLNMMTEEEATLITGFFLLPEESQKYITERLQTLLNLLSINLPSSEEKASSAPQPQVTKRKSPMQQSIASAAYKDKSASGLKDRQPIISGLDPLVIGVNPCLTKGKDLSSENASSVKNYLEDVCEAMETQPSLHTQECGGLSVPYSPGGILATDPHFDKLTAFLTSHKHRIQDEGLLFPMIKKEDSQTLAHDILTIGNGLDTSLLPNSLDQEPTGATALPGKGMTTESPFNHPDSLLPALSLSSLPVAAGPLRSNTGGMVKLSSPSTTDCAVPDVLEMATLLSMEVVMPTSSHI